MCFRGMASIRRAFVAQPTLPGCGTLLARLAVTSRRHAAIVTLPGKDIAEVSPPRPLTHGGVTDVAQSAGLSRK
jgi:hypothetical protein